MNDHLFLVRINILVALGLVCRLRRVLTETWIWNRQRDTTTSGMGLGCARRRVMPINRDASFAFGCWWIPFIRCHIVPYDRLLAGQFPSGYEAKDAADVVGSPLVQSAKAAWCTDAGSPLVRSGYDAKAVRCTDAGSPLVRSGFPLVRSGYCLTQTSILVL
jgi:hypothetical protein